MVFAKCIWSPRWSTREVLISKAEVRDGYNFVYFCVDKNHPDLYVYDGDEAKRCKLVSNGKISCYAIPMSYLQSVGPLPKEYEENKQKEYEKYLEYKEKMKKK